jgi:hypothetical protein
MTEVLVREQAAAQRDCFVSFRLLEQIVEVLERSSPQQAGVILIEGPVVEEMEVVPVIVADIERARTPLFLRDSDPMDMPFTLEASKDSEEDSGSNSGSKESGSDDGSFGAMDGDAVRGYPSISLPPLSSPTYSPPIHMYFPHTSVPSPGTIPKANDFRT